MERFEHIPKKYYPAINELPGDLAEVAQVIESVCPDKGVEATIAIAKAFRGTDVYFRNLDHLYRKSRNEWLIEQYGNGQRLCDLARQAGLSERQVWTIIGA